MTQEYNHHFENYPYELSDFQKQAIKTIVDGNHVLVTAHTGSGKTLPAEFAIKHFVKQGKKVIYTSPIKALSNQKYYDFTRKFPDITFGLLTGDIKTNPDADVLIMTTEILLNKLFLSDKGITLSFDMNIERDLAAVVFDECHYINDANRGHVWEQCILMLPQQVQMILLSATIDNPAKFAQWIAKSGKAAKTVTICSTNHRVVPLTHYMYVTSPEGLHKKINDKTVSAGLRQTFNHCLTIQDSDGTFNAQNYSTVANMLKLMDKHNINVNRKFVLNSLIEHLKGSAMLPAIVFVFSRKLVEQCAEDITVPLFNEVGDELIDIPFHKIRHECTTIIRRLPNWQEYAELPEYLNLVNLLEKGIGIHHSGMLPVLKEIVELMISKKYIRVLFATESFAIGLDCPIKTAVFISLKKHDGSSSSSSGGGPRYLMSHEYTQMAGRAGRRGIDTIGNVVHCVNLFSNSSNFLNQSTYKEILGGTPQRLVSKFKIDYKTVLNMIASLPEDAELIETTCNFIKQSMMSMEFDNMETGLKQEIANLEKDILNLQERFSDVPIEKIKEYWKMQEIRTMASNKKLKEIDRDSKKLVDEYPNILKDVDIFDKLRNLESVSREKHESLNSLNSYIETGVKQILGVLIQTGILDGLVLTKKGVICASIAEVNPVLMTALFEEFDDFADFEPEMLAAFLSIFTDVRLSSDTGVETPFLEKSFKQFEKTCDEIILCEETNGIRETIKMDDFIFAIADDVVEWCRCEDEHACKLVLHNLLLYKGVSVGDFTKALLKISTVVRELMSVCEKTGKVELMSRLSKIDRLILKHVTTNQSLYL